MSLHNSNWWLARAKNMVREQIAYRGIQNENLLEVMQQVPRHQFVSEKYKLQSYDDRPLPIGASQTISQPYIVALSVNLSCPDKEKTVLEIGSGCGYQTAILAKLYKKVFSIERINYLYLKAKNNIQKLNITNVELKLGDGYLGWQEQAPFSAIVVSCAAPKIPKSLVEQLAVGGKLIIPVGVTGQKLMEVSKISKSEIEQRDICWVSFVPMLSKIDD